MEHIHHPREKYNTLFHPKVQNIVYVRDFPVLHVQLSRDPCSVNGRDVPALDISSVRNIRNELVSLRDRVNQILDKLEESYPEPPEPPAAASPSADPAPGTVDCIAFVSNSARITLHLKPSFYLF